MEKKQAVSKFVMGAAIFILVLIIVQFRKGRDIVKYEIHPRKIITKLPKLNLIDWSGKRIKSKDLKGKVLYVQFVDPVDFDDVSLIKNVYSNWKDDNLYFIIVTKEIEKLKLKIGIDLKNNVIVTNDYEKLKSKFNSPPHSGTFYLFDSSGNVVVEGNNYTGYERGIKVFLNQLINHKYFSISDFIRAGANIKNIEWFSEFANIVDKEEKDYFVVSMFTIFSADCGRDRIVKTLQKIYSQNLGRVYVLAILYADLNKKEDLNILKSQSKVDFPLIIADNRLNQKWSSLIGEFRDVDLTDIVFVMNKSGEILKISDRSYRCYDEIFRFVDNLQKK